MTLSARAAGPAGFRVEVTDTGIGIAETDLPRLFVEFQQLDAGYSKQHQGTGLGLALTRQLVVAQGGTVGVRSTLGVGSVFHLELPRRPAPAEAPPSGGRLLVIEDDRPLRARMVQGLRAAGFEVDDAATGEDAVALATRRAYDAITLNLHLSDRQGLDALARIRHEGPSRDSAVLALTMPRTPGAVAAPEASAPAEVATFAIANLLAKPIRTAEVAAALARLPAPTGRRTRALVIDDDPLALELMRGTLQAMAIEPVCRLDARQALAELDQLLPDVIILDLMMPGFDGFATLDALRQRPAWCDTPVFIWTSMILSDAEVATLSRSAEAILGKGGGALAQVLDALGHWRPLPAPAGDGQAT